MCCVDSDSTHSPVHNTNLSINLGFSMAIMNCQSISSKKAAFASFVSDNSPDIIAGCESWLSPFISSSEVFQLDLQYTEKTEMMGMEDFL